MLEKILEKLKKELPFLTRLIEKMKSSKSDDEEYEYVDEDEYEEDGEETEEIDSNGDKTKKFDLTSTDVIEDELEDDEEYEYVDDDELSEEEVKKKKSARMKKMIVGGMIIFVVAELLFKDPPKKKSENFKKSKVVKQKNKPKTEQERPSVGKVVEQAKNTATGNEDTVATNDEQGKPVEKFPDLPEEIPPVIRGELSDQKNETIKKDQVTDTQKVVGNENINNEESIQKKLDEEKKLQESTQKLTDDNLSKSMETLVKKVKQQQKLEKQEPPNYLHLGRGLVYNCKGKHWACVNKDAYFQCQRNMKWVEQEGLSSECSTVAVYASVEDCQTVQIHYVNTSKKVEFCKP